MNKYKHISIEVVVFLSGCCLMILEMVGTRILSPFMGTSTVVWTALIGVILTFLSLGYYIGGKYADKKANLNTLSNILFFSSFAIFYIIIVNKPILEYIGSQTRFNSVISILSVIVLLFAPASIYVKP